MIKIDYKVVIVLAVIIVFLYFFLKNKIAAVGTAVNPVNPNNIINRGFHSVYNVLTDGQGSLGTDIYDFFHGDD